MTCHRRSALFALATNVRIKTGFLRLYGRGPITANPNDTDSCRHCQAGGGVVWPSVLPTDERPITGLDGSLAACRALRIRKLITRSVSVSQSEGDRRARHRLQRRQGG